MNNLCNYSKANCNECQAFIKGKKRAGCLFGGRITIYLKKVKFSEII
jgi:hypothetical protein